MINNIYNSGPYLSVLNSPGASPYINTSQPMTGMVRYVSNRLEVYDGGSWLQVGGGSASVSLTAEAIEILDWAKKRMSEESKIKRLAESNPTIADALATFEQAAEKLQVVISLCEE